MGLFGTALLGIAGSFLGGAFSNIMFNQRWDQPNATGAIGSVLGSLALLFILGRVNRTQV